MRASSLLIIILVFDAFLFFGMGGYENALRDPAYNVNNSMHGVGDRPFTLLLDFTENETDYEANTTILSELMEFNLVGAGVQVLESSGIYNLAQPMITLINVIAGLILAPFTFMELSGLNEATFGMANIFSVAITLLMILALWKIFTGRDT